MLAEAQQIKDPDVRKLALEAAHRYYEADIKQNAHLPFWALMLILVILYLLVFGTLVWAYSHLPGTTATLVCIASYCFVSLLVGVVLRVSGHISESSLLGIWKAGFKVIASLKSKAGPKAKP